MAVPSKEDAWLKLRGLLTNGYAVLGGGEEYLRSEREGFYDDNSPIPQSKREPEKLP
jgi:hypothetical protein